MHRYSIDSDAVNINNTHEKGDASNGDASDSRKINKRSILFNRYISVLRFMWTLMRCIFYEKCRLKKEIIALEQFLLLSRKPRITPLVIASPQCDCPVVNTIVCGHRLQKSTDGTCLETAFLCRTVPFASAGGWKERGGAETRCPSLPRKVGHKKQKTIT